jgi:hypothetical protein
MMQASKCFMIALLLPALSTRAAAQETGRDAARRMVLVELYTSQGCDMCPTAERMLGALGDRRIVPIALHVDYFNDPWQDVFSDPLYLHHTRRR